MPYSPSKTDRCFGGRCCFHRHSGTKRRTLHSLWATKKKEVVRSSETWVVIYKSIRHHIPEKFNFLQERSEKLKSRKTMPVLHYSVQSLSTNLSYYCVWNATSSIKWLLLRGSEKYGASKGDRRLSERTTAVMSLSKYSSALHDPSSR